MSAAEHAEGEQHAAAAEVADQVERRHRLAARRTDQVQHPCQRDVVDVVPRRGRERAVLPPARHPAVYQPGITRETRLGPEAEPLQHAGPEPFDQHVGALQRASARPRPRRHSSGPRAIDRRLRSSGSGGACSFGRAEARSMRTICAPRSASIMEQNGAGPIAAISTTLIPASGPITQARSEW